MEVVEGQMNVFSPDLPPPPSTSVPMSEPEEPNWNEANQMEEGLPPVPTDQWDVSQYHNEYADLPPPPIEDNIEAPVEEGQLDTDGNSAMPSEWEQQPQEDWDYQQPHSNEWTSYDQSYTQSETLDSSMQYYNEQPQPYSAPETEVWESQEPAGYVPEVPQTNWELPSFSPAPVYQPPVKPLPLLSDLLNIGGVKVTNPLNSGWDEPVVVLSEEPSKPAPPRRPPPPPPSATRKEPEKEGLPSISDPRIVFNEKIKIQLGKPTIRRNDSTSSESSGSQEGEKRTTAPTIDDDEYAPPPGQMVGGENEKNMEVSGGKSSSDWEEFQKMTQRCTEMMKKTQERLQQIQETSATKELSKASKYIMKPPTPPPNVDVLLGSELPSKNEGKEEWRPVSEILNEEIRKQKEMNKPHRPPPPRPATATPQRPPPPSPKSDPTAPNWDETAPVTAQLPSAHTSAGRNLSVTAAPFPSWDDEAAEFYANVPSYGENSSASQPVEDTSASQMSEAVLNPEEDAAIPGYTGFGSNIDYPSIFDDSVNQGGAMLNGDSIMSGATDYMMEDWKGQPDPFDTSAVTKKPPVDPGHIVENNNITKPKCDWASDFESARLPESQSDFFSKVVEATSRSDPFGTTRLTDPFAVNDDLLQSEYDPFEV